MSRVLLIDDNMSLLGIAKEFLTREEPAFDIFCSMSAYDALNEMKEKEYDVIVCDYQMPEMDGLKLLEKLRKGGNNVPFIIFTGRGREEVAMQALNLGADYYLLKRGEPKSMYGELAHIIKRVIEHRQTEEALRKSEHRHRNLFERTNDAMFILSLDNPPIVLEINQRAAKMLGYTKEELVGMTSEDIVVSTHHDRSRQIYEQPMTGKPIPIYERIFRRKNGSLLPVELNVALIYDENGNRSHIQSIVRDITDRKLAEGELRESEEKYRELVEKLHEGVTVEDADGIMTFINPGLAEMLGYTCEELEGKHWSFTVPESEMTKVQTEDEKRRQGISSNYESTLLKKDGSIIPVLVSATPLWAANGTYRGALGLHADISALKRAEEALKETEERYRELVEKLHEGVVVENRDGLMEFVNPRFAEMAGYSEDELIGLHWTVIVPPEDHEKIRKESSKRNEGISSTYEANLLAKDGQTIPIYISTTPLFFTDGIYRGNLAIFTDISQLKRTEEALRESEERYRTVLEQIEDGIYEVDLEGNFTFVNHSICRILGYPESELIGMNNTQYMTPEVAKRVYKTFNMVYRTGQPVRLFECEVVKKDGSKRIIESSMSRITDSEGKSTGFRGVTRDITERKATEEILRRSHSELHQGYEELQKTHTQLQILIKESEQRYRKLVENLGEGVIVENIEGVIILANQRASEILGYTEEELIGLDAFTLVHPDSQAKVQQEMTKRVNKSRSTYEAVVVTKEGHQRNIKISATPLFSEDGTFKEVLSAFSDITKDKQAEMALRESEERYRTILEQIGDGYCELDLAGYFTFVNEPMCKISGYDESELIGLNCRTIVDKKTATAIFQAFNEVYKTQKPKKGLEWEIIKKDGTKRIFEASASTILDSKGESIGFRGIVRDITERKQSEKSLKQQREDFQDFANRLLERSKAG